MSIDGRLRSFGHGGLLRGLATVYNTAMFGSSVALRRFALSAIVLGSLGATLVAGQDTTKRGRKYKAPPPTSHVEVTVTRATTGKPVENASVIFHPLVDGRDKGNMELKTNDDGKVSIDLLEIGSNVRVQIIAPGFQTYGEDYKIDKDQIALAVKLRRPTEQYSIYKKTAGNAPTKDDDANPDKPNPDKPKTDAKPDPKDASTSPEPQKDAPKDAAQQDTKPQPSTTPN
jgi:hypothetical protein